MLTCETKLIESESHQTKTMVTIITSTLNCCELLRKTINSIRHQNHTNIQWIIADGGSKDGTIELIKKNTDIVDTFFSEKDTGIYDAWNKACKKIKGEWIIFLGAGDIFCDENVLESAVKKMDALTQNIVVAYGSIVQKDGKKEIYRYGEVDLDAWDLCRPQLPSHQGVFQRHSLFCASKPFDDTYRVVADSKLLLQAKEKGGFYFLDMDICIMEPGGVSGHPKTAIFVMKEYSRLERDLGYKVPIRKKLSFQIRTYSKYFIYSIFGDKAYTLAAQFKRFFDRR